MSYVQNPLVMWLLSHSYGQGGTVAVPSVDPSAGSMPRGEFPPGIQDVLNYLSARYTSWSSAAQGDVDWCFLVGGPGNGKSEALRTLATMLGVTLPARSSGQAVSRVVPAMWPAITQGLPSGLNVAFINDASIPRQGNTSAQQSGSLFLDVVDALDPLSSGGTPIGLFANVNRGILVEEASALDTASGPPLTPMGIYAREAIRWLAVPPATAGATSVHLETVVPIAPDSPQYGQFRLRLTQSGASRDVVVHVVFLDVLSLLEPRPGAGGPVVDFTINPPRVAGGEVLLDGGSGTVGGQLFDIRADSGGADLV
jgi:hypothetical protein